MSRPLKSALILSGGGARAAYQIGVLKALADILPEDAHNPFPIICGTSAGAINALALATNPKHFRHAVAELEQIWRALTPNDIYHANPAALCRGMLRLGSSLFNEGIGRKKPVALLDNSPLRLLVERHIRFNHLEKALESGDLEAVCVTAMGYSSGQSVSFFQGHTKLKPWRRHNRIGTATALSADHLMASSAIPTIFPTVPINREYFGDGALRQLSPISPALHMGADRVFVIGVSGNRNPVHWNKQRLVKHSPSMAQIMGHMFNSAFVDSMEGDIEHLERINHLVSLIPEQTRRDAGLHLRPVESLIISPTQPLDKIAGRKIRYLDKSLRWFMRSVGATAKGGGAAAASYLLFTPPFCEALIDLGYKDAMWERQAIERFFTQQETAPDPETHRRWNLATLRKSIQPPWSSDLNSTPQRTESP